MEWAVDKHFEDRSTFAFPTRHVGDAALPAFTCEGDQSSLVIKTHHLTLSYREDGRPFNLSNLSVTLQVDGQDVTWRPDTPNNRNLRGTTRTLDQCAGATNLSEGLLSRDGWSVFDDSSSVIWDTDQTWLQARPDNHLHDWYFFGYGHDYKALLREYLPFGGDVPLVPRYVLGVWWSRFWAYHAEDLKQLVNDFNSHDVPLDVLVVDMDWHTPDGWTGYTWNRNLFPDPEGFLKWVHEQKLYSTFNLHPAEGVQKHEAAYAEFAERIGHDTSAGAGIAFSATDKAFVEQYFALLHHPMEEQGVDFWWVDWQQGSETAIKNLDPLPWLNHLHFRDSTRRGTRPLLYSRWGGLGNHRYPIGFSGDAYTTWETLAFQPYFTATASNVVYGWWSHDIGGHFGAADPELYARWVQFGAVSPCLRLHSTKDPLAERRPWGFTDEVYEASKAAMQFRYALLPYLYSAARATANQGLSLCYPMYYEYPDSEDAYLARGQYFLGDQLIVAPIVSPRDAATGLATVNVWIPEGTWVEYTTLEQVTGPRWVQVHGDLNRIPMFAKAGGILPMSPGLMRTQDLDGSRYTLTVFAGGSSRFDLYEDDGTTEAYLRGEYAVTPITVTANDDHTTIVTIAASEGHSPCLPASRTFTLVLKAVTQPTEVAVNGAAFSNWQYDTATRTLTVSLPEASREAAQQVTVHSDAAAVCVSAGTPFVHLVDYDVYEDASQQLAALVIVPAADGTPFDAEVEWAFQQAGEPITAKTVTLKGCAERQIVTSPFKGDGTFTPFRWSVAVNLFWGGETLHYSYQSQDAYPAVTRWQTHIYNPHEKVITIKDVASPKLAWTSQQQSLATSFNLKQPYGMILLEKDRQRITNGEPLAAVARTNLQSATAQDAVLLVQAVGETSAYLNGQPLTPTEAVAHAKLDPAFPSWMPPTQTYYHLPLQAGDNQLVIFSKPDTKISWWGISASVFDKTGKLVI